MPAGLFSGKSKQLYDCLYSLTRGAVVPKRTVRISRPKLMAKAHIGARITFDANIERLIKVGLIRVRQITGEHEGNEYIVLLPEEVEQSMSSMTSQGSHTSMTDSAQNLDRLVSLESSQTSHSLSTSAPDVSEPSKTFYKTDRVNDDDEAFAGHIAALKKAAREVTGKDTSPTDAERWREVADVLVTELKIAAARTTVSSAPAFLAEHLRRRLFKKDKRQIEAEAATVTEQGITASSLDVSKCPDCGGTKYWYPEGYEKGVARCRHERLSKGEERG